MGVLQEKAESVGVSLETRQVNLSLPSIFWPLLEEARQDLQEEIPGTDIDDYVSSIVGSHLLNLLQESFDED